MLKILGLFALVLLLGCEKPNPTPEKGDAIYSDLSSQADSAAKTLDSEKKKLEGLKKELAEAKPYTGELKAVQRRYFESEKRVQQLAQEKYFYSLRARSRQAEVRQAYQKNFATKKIWDGGEEAKSYQEFQRISKIPLSWDSKRRIANYEQETGFGGSNKKPAVATPAKASGGH